MALDRGDDGLRQQHPRRSNGAVAVGLDAADPGQARFTHRLEVGAGAEGATGAGEHRHGLAGGGVEVPEGVGEVGSGGTVDGVGHLGTVDRDDGDRAVGRDAHGHGAPVGLSSRRGWRPST